MLQEAHKALEAMHKASNCLKMEQWGEAERALVEVQETVGRLLREVGDKVHEEFVLSDEDGYCRVLGVDLAAFLELLPAVFVGLPPSGGFHLEPISSRP